MANEQNYDVGLNLNFNDKGLVEIQEQQIDLVKKQIKAFNEMEKVVNKMYDDAVAQQQAYTDAIKENLTQLKGQDLQIKRTSAAAQLYERAIDRITDTLGGWKQSATGVINGLTGFVKGMVGSVSQGNLFIKVLKGIRVALISTGIGAIVVALVGLVLAFGRTQAGAEKLKQVMAAVSAVVDVFIGRLARIGTAIIGFVTGSKSLSQAGKEIAGSFKGINKELSESARLAVQVEKTYQDLAKRQRELTVEQSKGEKKLAELAAIYDAQNVSAGKAIGAIKDAQGVALGLNEKELKLAKDRLKNIEQEIKLQKNLVTAEAQDKRAEALVEVNQLETERVELVSEYQGRLSAIRAEQAKEAKERREQLQKLKDDYAKILESLDDRLNKASITGLDGIEKLLAERDVAIAELVDFQASIEKAAKDAGIKIPEETRRQIVSLYADVEDEFVRQAAKFRKENPFKIDTFLNIDGKENKEAAKKFTGDVIGLLNLSQKEQVDEIDKLGRELGKSVKDKIELGLVESRINQMPIFDRIKEGLIQAFNISEEELGLITDLIGQSISSATDLFTSGVEAQIAANDRLIVSIEESVAAKQKAVDDELKTQTDGFANYAKIRDDELKAEQARLAEAQRQKQELEKKALRQQLVSDSLAQASQLTLAAIKVTTAESGKGLLGIITALSAVALIFRIAAQARANAAKFAPAPKFRTGGKLEGASHEGGGIPILVSGSRLVEAEGGEFIIRKKSTSVNEEFFNRVNKGHYDDVNLVEVIERRRRYDNAAIVSAYNLAGARGSIVSGVQARERASNTSVAIDKAIISMRDELKKSVDAVRDEIKKRPVIKPMGTGYTLEFYDGNTFVQRIVRPEK